MSWPSRTMNDVVNYRMTDLVVLDTACILMLLSRQ